MSFKVQLSSSSNQYSVKLSPDSKFKVISGREILANLFTELSDVNITNLDQNKDKYVVTYNASTGKFVIVDPDVVLSAASTDAGPQPGLPSDFLNTLDVDLDNRIDLDAGTF
jgi:hypothetical protein